MAQRLNIITNHISTSKHPSQARQKQLLKNSSANPQELYRLVFDQRYQEVVGRVYQFLYQNRSLYNFSDRQEMSLEQQRESAAKQMIKLLQFAKVDLTNDTPGFFALFYAIGSYNMGLAVKTFLHYTLFIASIMLFKQQDQPLHQQILDEANQLKIIGCFGLTQFYHGSYSRGIATEAIYDDQTGQFIIDSNGQLGMKFWIGAAAQMANSSVIWAQLIVKGKRYGPHPFIVPLRDRVNHDLLQGVVIGDCGHKQGINNIDNGFIILRQVRVGRQYLLGRVGHVDAQGNYHSPAKNNNHRFGMHMSPLSAGRAMISLSNIAVSNSAATIAYRYISNRRQFTNPNKNIQQLIIDYPTSKYRLMPILATNMVYLMGGYKIVNLYFAHRDQLTDPNGKVANELHAISGIAKAKSTWFVNKSITECRQLMGGHGFSSFSHLGSLYVDMDVNTTWEGDNNMLLQQTSKYILRNANSSEKSYVNITFISENLQSLLPASYNSNILSLDVIQLLLKWRLQTRFNAAVNKMQQLKQKGHSDYDIWNMSQPYQCNQLSLSFGDYYYFITARQALKKANNQANIQIINNCIRLWALNTLQKEKFMSIQFRQQAQRHIISLCQAIYKESAIIIKAIGVPNYIYGSPFANEHGEGMKDYLNLIYSANNTFTRVDWFEEFIKLRDSQ